MDSVIFDDGGPGGDFTSSSEMSFELANGVGMGRPTGKTPRANFQLADYLPKQIQSSNSSTSRKLSQLQISKETTLVEPSSGPVWKTLTRDPQSHGVIVGSWNNKYPFFGRVTRFESFEDSTYFTARDFKSSGCSKLVALNNERFAAAFCSGNIFILDYSLTDHSITKICRHYGAVAGMRSSHDGCYLMSCGRDRKISKIDVSTGYVKDEIREAHLDGVHDLSPDPTSNNRLITCGQDGAISLWDWRLASGGRDREVAHVKIPRTPTAVHWSNVDPNQFYVGMFEGTLACYDIRDLAFDITARQVNRDCKITSIKPIDHGRIAILSECTFFDVLNEKSLITAFTSSAAKGIIQDIVQVEESTIYSVGSVRGFTKHNVINNSHTQTDLESDEETI